jgi:RNA polymerase sigma-70 factor (ECF subfamily)
LPGSFRVSNGRGIGRASGREQERADVAGGTIRSITGGSDSKRAETDTARAGPEPDALWLAGDTESACKAAHHRYASRLEAVALRIVGNRADAQDVVQRIFVALGRSSFQGQSSLWTYLYRAVINGSVNVLRSTRRRQAAERNLHEQELLLGPTAAGYPGSAASLESPESKVLEGEILAGVAQALLYVKPQHRRVLVLRIVHGMTNAEIAELEGLPAATVGTWLRRGRQELQRNLRPLLRELGRGPR